MPKRKTTMPKRKTTKSLPRFPSPADAKAIAAGLKIPEEDVKQLGVRKFIKKCANGTRRYTIWSAGPITTMKKSRVDLIRALRKAAAKKAAKTKTKAKNKAKDKTKTKAKDKTKTKAKAKRTAAKAKTTAKTTVKAMVGNDKDIHIHISINPTRRGTRDRKQRFNLDDEFAKGAEFETCTVEESYKLFE